MVWPAGLRGAPVEVITAKDYSGFMRGNGNAAPSDLGEIAFRWWMGSHLVCSSSAETPPAVRNHPGHTASSLTRISYGRTWTVQDATYSKRVTIVTLFE